MDALNPHKTITLPEGCCSGLCGIAFDGCFFYLAAPQESRICKLKRDFTMAGSIKTDRPYHCICYDSSENCFWATEKRHHDVMYKLNRGMKEIGRFRIGCDRKVCSPVIGLSYDCEKDVLLAACKEHIVEVSKGSGRTHVIREAHEGFYAAILSIAPYYAIVRQDRKDGQRLDVFTRQGRCIRNVRMPDSCTVRDVLLYPCDERCRDELEFMLLAKKDGCNQCVLLKIRICDMVLCDCNYDVCHARCREEEENERCICDVIESVALVETSLSHILNAEGEKLQKAVKLASSIDELLAVNRSVTKTIINAAQLEHHLYLKLDALNDFGKKPSPHKHEMK